MCTCSENTTPCENQECGCKFEVDAGCVRYSGDNLDSSGIVSGDTLETTLINISQKLSELSPGDYITMGEEPAGDNCEFGGVKLELRDGTTGLVKNTEYICGVDTANNATGTVQSIGLSINETGNNVTGSVANPTTFPVITLNIPEASATKTGKISASDWNKFNNKQDALSGTPNYIAKWSATDDLTDSIIYETAGGLLGVGLSTPSAKLHISNTTTTSDSFLVEDESNVDSTPFVINNSGNVGIGVTSPSTKLQILAATSINNTTLSNAPLLVGTSTSGIGIDANEIYAASELSVGTFGSTSNILFKANASQQMIIHTGGNVGIGTSGGFTPTAKLHVVNNVGNNNSFLVEDVSNVDSTPFVINDAGNVGIGLIDPSNSRLWIDNTVSNNNSLYIESSNNTENLPVVVKYSGAVGVGTDQPVTRFQVKQIDNNSSVAEEIARFGMVNNDTAYFSIRSINSTTGEFTPDLRGVQNATTTDTALSLTGLIHEDQDNSIAGNTFKYEAGKPAVLFRAVKAIGSESRHILNRRLFEFRNDSSVIMSMDPTGGIKVHRGDQDNKDPEVQGSGGIPGAYTQYIHMHGDGGGNYIESFCAPGNTKTLKIRATTNLANDPATNSIPLNPDFPGIMLQTYDKTALTVDNTANVGVGTTELSVSIRAKLHTVSGTTESPATDLGKAFVMFEGFPTTGKVIVAHDSIGATTWSKVTSAYTEGWSNPSLTVLTPGGERTLTIVNGLITGIV